MTRRLACWARGHDHVLTPVPGRLAILACARCARRVVVTYRPAPGVPSALSAHAERFDVELIDRGALEHLRLSAEVGGIALAALLDGEGTS